MSIVTQPTDAAKEARPDEAYARFRAIIAARWGEPRAQPSRDDVAAVAHLLRPLQPDGQVFLSHSAPRRVGLGTAEGRTYRLTFAPGVLAAATLDARKAAGTRGKVGGPGDRDRYKAPVLVTEDGEVVEPAPRSEITEWSGKSRARMVRTIGELDLSEWMTAPGDLAMVTLTLPGDWLAVAPTGRAFKALVRAFSMRWKRALGAALVGLWKLEFQGRGAPHLHMLVRVPALVAGRSFEAWLSETWADVVDADDTWCHRCAVVGCGCEVPDTERARHVRAGTGVDFDTRQYGDPRRIGIYFAGHSLKHTDGKEYQHVVPEAWQAPGAGPGRFWGYWGLTKGTVVADVDPATYDRARRALRHLDRARRLTTIRQRQRAGVPTGALRPVRSLGHNGGDVGGFVLVNDGVATGHVLARWLLGDDGRGHPSFGWPLPGVR